MLMRLTLLGALLAAPAARAEWHEASSAHFVVYSDDDPVAIRDYAEELEKFDKALRVRFGVSDPDLGPANRVKVYILPKRDSVAKLAGDEDVAGFYIPRAGENIAFVPRPSQRDDPSDLSGRTVLRHEYAHHFMYSLTSSAFPMWFSEGFAEFWSTAKYEKDGTVLIGSAPRHRAAGLFWSNPMPVQRLLTYSDGKLDGLEQEAVYGRGWLLTHYLTFSPQRAGQLPAYIAAINRGESLEKAAGAFGELTQLERELRAYLKQRRISGTRIAAAALTIRPVTVRKLTPGEVATMDVRIRSQRGVTDTQAAALVPEARKAASGFDGDAGAQLVLAEAEYDAGNHGLAEAAADRALKADPKSVRARIYKAMARMAALSADTNAQTAAWEEPRKWIVAANRLDPDNPQPLILYYRSFAEAGEPASQIAKDGLARAFELAPSDIGLRMNVAQLWLSDGKRDAARAALKPIAYHPHLGGMAATARKMIAAIDRGDTDAGSTTTESANKD